MKFKLIFLLFNIVLVVSFLVIYLMPLLVLGWDYTRVFWANNWFLPLIFVCIIGVLNAYFALNWRLFRLLEKEDWNGLVDYLEKQIYSKNRLRKQYIRILINGYLVNSRTEEIRRLEAHIRDKKPRILPSFALLFGIPYLLRNDPAEMESYFGGALAQRGVSDRPWIEWNHAFSLMLLKRREEARAKLKGVADATKEPVLLLLSIYLLEAFTDSDTELEQTLEHGKNALKRRYSPVAWQKEIESAKENVEVVVLTKLVQEATEWLFSFGSAGNAKAVH
ncbi:MAG TPA: hypothetical protein VMV68_08670 [Spirochaetia bacterium]|nr:hypothetical protein [Spirochaetia bacterium]